MTDTWVQRTAAEYAAALEAELPQGAAWSRDPDKGLMKWVDGCAQIFGDVSAAAAKLAVVESDPQQTTQMLPDWEAAFGLPDACNSETLTLASRRAALVQRLTLLGAQNKQFFVSLAASVGYSIDITEYSPFMAGVSRCGDTRQRAPQSPSDVNYRWQVGEPTIRFYWTVNVYGESLSWFRCGGDGGQCGAQTMLTISGATDLECLFRRYKPAHTQVVFNFESAGTPFSNYVWFRCGGSSQCGVDTSFESVA